MSDEVNVQTTEQIDGNADVGVFQTPDYAKSIKYFSQLPKEITEDADAMDSIKDYATIADLVKGYREAKSKGEGAIHVPKQDATLEEKAEFLKKLGVPTSKAGYKINLPEDASDGMKELRDNFIDIFSKAALTNVQANRVFENIARAFVEGGKKQQESEKAYHDSFDQRQTDYLKTLTKVDDEVKAFKERDLSLTNVFLHDTNLGEELRKSGLLLDPVVLHKIAEYQEQRQPKASFNSSSPDSKGGFDYSSEFQRIYGGKK